MSIRIGVASVHRDFVVLFAHRDDDEFKVFLPVTIEDAEHLGEMLREVREVAAKVSNE